MADPFKILVPVGFSEQSMLALDQAVVFAKAAQNAELTLLTVIEENGFFSRMFSSKSKNDHSLKEKVHAKLKETAENYAAQTNLKFNTMVATGTVYEEIARVSELLECKLVVMGTNGKPQNLRKRFIGSNAFRTATMVEPPVVTVKGVRKPEKIDTIIFPLVLDRRSKEKVGPAMYYARLFDAQIKVVAINNDKEEEKIFNAHLKQVEKFITDHGVTCTAELIDPIEGKGIVRNTLHYAYENDGDLMIITEDSKKRDFSDYFLGTDVQSMLYHSEIPVMCITPSEVKWEAMWNSF